MEGSASPRKPSVRDALEVIERGDLARRVARERERQFGGRDALAVVANADQPDAAVLDVDRHLTRAGIERVLDQLLDDGCRALDDLARGDLVDERAFEDPDGHGERRGNRRASLAAGRLQVPATGISRIVPEATVSVSRWFFCRSSSMLTA